MKTEVTLGSPLQKENQPITLEGGKKAPIQKALQKVQSLPHNLNISSHEVLKKSSSCAMLGDNFTKNLISKIRGVSRGHQRQRQINKMVIMTPSSTSKLQKSKQNYISTKEKFNSKPQHFPTEITFRQTTCQRQENNLIITTLESKVKALEQENKELLEKVESYDCEMFISRQQIEQLMYEIQCKDSVIKELEEYIQEREEQYADNQNKIRQDYNKLRQQYEEMREEMEKRQLTQVINATSSQNFIIQTVLHENFTPSFEKLTLYKANCEIVSLKKCISSLQKTFKANYNQLKQQKDKQISQMRRSFAKNLSHYKQIIMKFTTKTLSDTKKGREQLHQTAITENGSNQEIGEQ